MGISSYYSTKAGKRQYQRAFTIIELLVVVVVIAILASITIVSYNGITKKADESALKVSLRNAATKLVLSDHPSDLSTAGVESTDSVHYEYSKFSSGYCLTAFSLRSTGMAFHIDSSGNIQDGSCDGHSVSGPSHPVTQNPDTSLACLMSYETSSFGGGITITYTYPDNEDNNPSSPPCPRDVGIPSTIGGLPVVEINYDAFYGNQLTSVTIPNSVVQIGFGAFENNQLTSVTIPDSVTTVQGSAFANNQITSVSLPSHLSSLQTDPGSNWAFAGNSPDITFIIRP